MFKKLNSFWAFHFKFRLFFSKINFLLHHALLKNRLLWPSGLAILAFTAPNVLLTWNISISSFICPFVILDWRTKLLTNCRGRITMLPPVPTWLCKDVHLPPMRCQFSPGTTSCWATRSPADFCSCNGDVLHNSHPLSIHLCANGLFCIILCPCMKSNTNKIGTNWNLRMRYDKGHSH